MTANFETSLLRFAMILGFFRTTVASPSNTVKVSECSLVSLFCCQFLF